MTVDDFLDLVTRSQLFDSGGLERIAQQNPPASTQDDAAPLADWMVSENLLTRYQADRLLAGKWHGLVMGPYEIRDFLGKGGMGSVLLAWDRNNLRLCALKILPREKSTNNRNVLRFRREIEVSRLLEHPGLAIGFEAGIWEDTPYLALEYVPGPTLFRLIKKSGPLPVYWAATWIGQVAAAIDHAHLAGIIHRDLKPSNVIIMPSGHAKVLDLGLARWYDDDHNEDDVVGRRRIVGSFDYIAPEQASNSARADARSDIYAMGCLLYFALTGKPPFHHVKETKEKISHHKEVVARPLAALRTDLPGGFAGVVERMMAKDPQKRYQVAAQVRDVLDRWTNLLLSDLPREPALPPALAGFVPASARPPVRIPGNESETESPVMNSPNGERGFWHRLSRLFRTG